MHPLVEQHGPMRQKHGGGEEDPDPGADDAVDQVAAGATT